MKKMVKVAFDEVEVIFNWSKSSLTTDLRVALSKSKPKDWHQTPHCLCRNVRMYWSKLALSELNSMLVAHRIKDNDGNYFDQWHNRRCLSTLIKRKSMLVTQAKWKIEMNAITLSFDKTCFDHNICLKLPQNLPWPEMSLVDKKHWDAFRPKKLMLDLAWKKETYWHTEV